jgi:predicted nucleotidyltransferase component of viral defense system
MIHRNAIIEWGAVAPWRELRFIEQDLLLSRALTAIFDNEYLRQRLAFRGGTAMYKLYLSPPARYSEDIDLVQINAEPIGEVLDHLKNALSFLGLPRTTSKERNNTLIYRVEAEEPQGTTLRLKIEINCREHFSVYRHETLPFEIRNQWFSGKCDIVTYCFDELIGTKIRALYQRRKGRDLFDLYSALKSGRLNIEVAIDCYRKHMAFQSHRIPTALEYAENLEEKMNDEFFRIEVFPFLTPGVEYDIEGALSLVNKEIIAMM